MRRPLIAAIPLALVVAVLVPEGRAPDSGLAQEPVRILVTSTADDNSGVCPHTTNCTLRKAIETANETGGDDPILITFAPAVFPNGSPAVITVTAALPAIARASVTIDASEAGVAVDGSALEAVADGISSQAAGTVLRGLRMTGFGGACLRLSGAGAVVGGDASTGQGNRAAGCAEGIHIGGAGAVVRGNVVGFAALSDEAGPVGAGIVVNAGGAVLGGASIPLAQGNIIGNTPVAVRVGNATGAVFTGVEVARNVFGRSPRGAAAAIGTAVFLGQLSSGSTVRENIIANAAVGVAVAGTVDGVAVIGNRITGNRFEAISGLAIDLGANGVTDPNDPGDTDSGSNGLRNHPVFTRATQARIAGSTGTACGGCLVELYVAAHTPGGQGDYGTTPVPVALATADGGGDFAFDSPPVAPGTWVIAIATDAEGNTSEFGPSTRVGAGAIQCGNLSFPAGWSNTGFFGPDGVTLGSTFPLDPERRVRAIYHQEVDGSYTHWFRDTATGRTLTSLQAGEAYWFLADGPFALPAGFSLTVPLPQDLEAGWNNVVYFGATADVRDAFATVRGKYAEVYRYVNDGTTARWARFGDDATPAYARDFTEAQACAAYLVRVTEDAVLTPLQP